MTTDLDNLFDSFLLVDEEELEDGDQLDVKSIVIRSQYIMDGASTLEEASDMLRAFADYIDSLNENGYELTSMIQDDRGFVTLVD